MDRRHRGYTFQVEDHALAAWHSPTAGTTDSPLLVALHGGGYTHHYFRIATPQVTSFIDTANQHGYNVLAFDRPGYGHSSPLRRDRDPLQCQAELIAMAITQASTTLGASSVVLVGHSIGAMIALNLAASDHDFNLIGLAVTGIGVHMTAGGAGDMLTTAAGDGDLLEMPANQREALLFGPEWTYAPETPSASCRAYAPFLTREVVLPEKWTQELPSHAPRVTVPVHYAVAEYDSVWTATPESVTEFAALFTRAPYVDAGLARGTGHSIRFRSSDSRTDSFRRPA